MNKTTIKQKNIVKYYKLDTAFSLKKYCSSLVLAVKILIFVRNDAEAPP